MGLGMYVYRGTSAIRREEHERGEGGGGAGGGVGVKNAVQETRALCPIPAGEGIQEQLLRRNVRRGGLVFKAHRLVKHSTLGLSIIKKMKKKGGGGVEVVDDAVEETSALC